MIDTRLGLSMEVKDDRIKSNRLLVDCLLDLIESHKPKCFIEIGAYSADFSRRIKSLYTDAKSYAFEANPYNFSYFSKKYDFNNIGVNYINMAISEKIGSIKFNIQKNIMGADIDPIAGNNSILERNREGVDYESVEVDSSSVFDFVFKNKIEDDICLWIDVEGAGEQVLKGCNGIFDKVMFVFIEVEEERYWKEQWLESDVRTFLENNDFILFARDGEYAHQYNQIYINKRILA